MKGLRENETKSLLELKERLCRRFQEIEIILYGSKARGDSDKDSDIDLLILVDSAVTSKLEEDITRIAVDIELSNDVVFGKMIENKDFWNSLPAKAMPFHWNVDKEGIRI